MLGFFVGEETTVFRARRRLTMFRWIRARRPAMFAAVVEAFLVAAVAFGTDLSKDQVAALSSVAAVVFGLIIQEVVTPTAKIREVEADPTVDTGRAVREIVSTSGPITKTLRAIGGLFRGGD